MTRPLLSQHRPHQAHPAIVRELVPTRLAHHRAEVPAPRGTTDVVGVPAPMFRQLLAHLAVAVAHDCRSTHDDFVYHGNPFGTATVWLWDEGRLADLAHTVKVLATELVDTPGARVPDDGAWPQHIADVVRRSLPVTFTDSAALVSAVEETVRSMLEPTPAAGAATLAG